MIDDRSNAPHVEDVEGDVCVIGAGAAGLTIASSLQRAGRRVIVVESGGLTENATAASLKGGSNWGIEHDGLAAGRRFVFGGTTSAWAGQCVRLDDTDFADRPYLPFRGWPISGRDLAPYYTLAEKTFQIEGLDWQSTGWNRLGLDDPFSATPELASRGTVYTPAPSMKRLRRELLRSRFARILLDTTAVELDVTDTGGSVRGVTCVRADHRRIVVRVPQVVLCGGAIENARLLLLSNRRRGEGLGNENDHVGRYFQEHPNVAAAELQLSDRRLQDRFQSVYFAHRKWWPKIGPAPEWQASHGTMQGICNVMFEYPTGRGVDATKQLYREVRGARRATEIITAARAAVSDLPDVLDAVHRRYRHGLSPRSAPARAWLQVSSEQSPSRSSVVSLDAERRDRLGRPTASVDWNLNDLDFTTARDISRLVGATLVGKGLARVAYAPWLEQGRGAYAASVSPGYHHAGTTRMSLASRSGVVDVNGEVHSVRGLFICGASVFPTSGWANPTLTVVALAHRLSEFICARTATRVDVERTRRRAQTPSPEAP